mmetsp:Transcript_10705/g.21663  ORF Transcript_10705/g.21663 Transcript_10705/m.21663 type:complete len:108 (-) Transcript_10705:177-500(-)
MIDRNKKKVPFEKRRKELIQERGTCIYRHDTRPWSISDGQPPHTTNQPTDDAMSPSGSSLSRMALRVYDLRERSEMERERNYSQSSLLEEPEGARWYGVAAGVARLD